MPLRSTELPAVHSNVFPLLLTPFERYMLADDRPEYPMTCAAQMRLLGTIDRAAFSEAFHDVLMRHPMLSATVDRSNPRTLRWVLGGESVPAIQWRQSEDPDNLGLSERINLESEAGMRFQMRQGPDNVLATMVFHHACCDGIGAARFFEDLLLAYHSRVDPRASLGVLPAAETSRLSLRGNIPRIGRFCPRVAEEARIFIREGRHWLFHPVTPLGYPPRLQEPDSYSHSLEEFPTCEFDLEFCSQLRTAAKRWGITVNDVLVAAAFVTISEWNAKYKPQGPTPWLRVAVPQNLREAADRWMPASNKVTMCFITRGQNSCRSPSTLLKTIGVEMAAARYWLRGKSLIRAMGVAQAIPVLERRFLEQGRCLATVVLSNLGDYDQWFCSSLPREGRLIRAGNVRLESIVLLAPVRPQTHAAFCVATYGGILRVSVRHDPKAFSDERAEELLALYASKVQTMLK